MIKIIIIINIILIILLYYLYNIYKKKNLIENNRIKFYLGELSKNNKYILNDDKLNIDILKKDKDKNSFNVYHSPLINLLEKNNYTNKSFYFNPGDIEKKVNIASFIKNRITNDGVILRCLDYERHWNNYYNKPIDINYNDKIPKIIWRGVTTGNENRIGNRFTLVKKWFNKDPYIDIGFSNIVQDKDNYKKYLKNEIKIEEFLKYKYILSVEGNDKDSGLNWKLNSNSLVFMVKPNVSSWLMETKLIPNKHYIMLNEDFSDLKEKLIWCNNNQDKCIEIIKNANKFMDQFRDNDYENNIEKKVLKEYFKRVK